MELTSLLDYCLATSTAGYLTIEYFPTDWVVKETYEKLRDASNQWLVDIPKNQGAWMKAPVIPGPRNWNENQIDNNQGGYYEQLVSGQLPRMRPGVSGQLALMKNHKYLLRLLDGNGQYWLLGTLREPFVFNYRATTGSDSTVNGYQISFAGDTLHPAAGFQF